MSWSRVKVEKNWFNVGLFHSLSRYYRQAWQDLHESTSKQHNGLRRKETLDQPQVARSREDRDRYAVYFVLNQIIKLPLFRSRENPSRSRDFAREGMGLRDGSEMMVSDVCVKGKACMLAVLIFISYPLLLPQVKKNVIITITTKVITAAAIFEIQMLS